MVNIGIVGDTNSGKTSLASILGKRGTDSDITFFNNRKNEVNYIYIDSKNYPVTVKSLITTINLSDIIILCIEINNITKNTGECIIALDLLNINYGIIALTKSDTSYHDEIHNFSLKIKKLVSGTKLENWTIIPINTLKSSTNPFSGIDIIQNKINEYLPIITKKNELNSNSNVEIYIDHFFNVTGIGIVILGKIITGSINIHDKLILYPPKKKIEIRSIQINDENCKKAISGDRVGIGIKGIIEKNLERGFIISNSEDIMTTNKLKLKVKQSKYYNNKIKEGDILHVFIGLQNNPIKVNKVEKINNDFLFVECTSQKQLSFLKNDLFLISNLEGKQRFVGNGTIECY